MITTPDTSRTKEACPITTFVITLGKAMLLEKHVDWLDMDAAAHFCRQHGVQLNGKYPAASELESTLRQFFEAKDDFYAPGVNVEGYERPKGWDRPFQIKAYPYAPEQQPVRSGFIGKPPDIEGNCNQCPRRRT